MQDIREYLLGVIAAACICAIVTQIPGKSSFPGVVIKLIAGIFMLLSLVSPLTDVRLKPISAITDVSRQANEITASAEDSTRESIAQIIKERTQAYILDKAESLGADLSVEITLSEDSIPTPVGVSISGNISPYSKKILSQTIAQDLGIDTEAQIWN